METLLDNSNQDTFDPSKDYLNEYVGEGKKYKSQEDLAKAYYHAETALRNREARLDTITADFIRLKEENSTKAKLEDYLAQIDSKRQQLASNTQTPIVNEGKEPKILDEEQIDRIFSNKIRDFEISKRQQENFDTVKAKLTERYGSNYQSFIRDQINQLGLTEEDVNSLAKKSPTAFFKTLGLEDVKRENFQAPPRSTGTFSPKALGGPKPQSYYDELKKTNPKILRDPKILQQMDKDAQALGESFFDVD